MAGAGVGEGDALHRSFSLGGITLGSRSLIEELRTTDRPDREIPLDMAWATWISNWNYIIVDVIEGGDY